MGDVRTGGHWAGGTYRGNAAETFSERHMVGQRAGAPTSNSLTVRVSYSSCWVRMRSAALSPITTHGAMMLPVMMRGMIEASAMRRPLMP
jgi:hypothetical protein